MMKQNTSKRKKALVTGGAGFIGSHLTEYLLGEFEEVVVFDNFATGKIENLDFQNKSSNLVVFREDIRDLDALQKALKEVHTVFHLATHCVRASLDDPLLNHEVNATGTLNVLMESLKANVKKFVYCSSSEVFGESLEVGMNRPLKESDEKKPTTVYGASKLVGEHYTQAFHVTHGLETIIVRPFNAYGPRSHLGGAYGEVIPRFFFFADQSKAVPIYGNGKQTRDFTYVKDTARGIALAAKYKNLNGQVVHLGQGCETSILELIGAIETTLKKPIEKKFLSSRPGELSRLWADTSLAQELFGFKPEVSLNEGLDQYWNWLKPRLSQTRSENVKEVNWNLHSFQ